MNKVATWPITTWPDLYKKSKTGKITKWSIWVDEDDNNVPVIHRESGYLDGKRNVKKRFIRKGTNIGKVNEKTPYEHAVFLAQNYYNNQIEHNFVTDINDVDEINYVYPMLAKTYKEGMVTQGRKGKPIFPCYAQPKMNGVRCFTRDGDYNLWSRQLKEFVNIPHIQKAVENIRKNSIFEQFCPDGEIYRHGEDFQTLISWLKREQDGSELLEYWIYDLAVPDVPFKVRHKMIEGAIPDNHPIFKKVPTVLIKNHEDVIEWHNKFVAEGYEGIILRDPDGKYGFNDRGYELMKYKNFVDEEFTIVGAEFEEWDDTTTGTMRKIVVWVCETTDGNRRFNVRPIGSMMKREELWNNRKKYFGKPLTVRFQEYSQEKVPIFPTGIAIRDYE